MQNRCLEILVQVLVDNGWKVEWNVKGMSPNLAELRPSDRLHMEFVTRVSTCVAQGGTVWLLAHSDYQLEPVGIDTIHWDFIRALALDAASGDREWTAEIEAFWAQHLPIALNTRGDYGYLALRADGAIVEGFAPDEMATSIVAPSYRTFVELAVESLVSGGSETLGLWFERVD